MNKRTKILSKMALCAVMLCVLTIATSCKFGRAINDVKDNCPITLDDGITITNVESVQDGKGVKISVVINADKDEVPDANSSLWNEVISELRSLMYQNPACSELLNVAAKDNKFVSFTIYSPSHQILYPSLTKSMY